MEQIKASRDGLRATLKRIADLEDELHYRQQMIFKLKKIERASQSARNHSAPPRWALAA